MVDSTKTPTSTTSNPLTKKQKEVLRLAAQGVTTKEIAKQLWMAHGTVRNHISAIVKKTNSVNRLEAVKKAQKHGWI